MDFNRVNKVLFLTLILLVFLFGQAVADDEFCGTGAPPATLSGVTCCTDTVCGCDSKICGGDDVAISDNTSAPPPLTDRLIQTNHKTSTLKASRRTPRAQASLNARQALLEPPFPPPPRAGR